MEASSNIMTQTDNMSTDEIKATVDIEYDEKPYGGSKTPWIIGGLAIALIIIFIIVMITFFVIGNNPQMHEIAVVNNCNKPINVLVGTEIKNARSKLFIGPKRINPGETSYYYATPAVFVVIKGYYDDINSTFDVRSPLTKALIWFNDNEYNGPTQISHNNEIINVPRLATNGNKDNYDVSMQDGFNIQIGIFSNNKNSDDPFSCGGPSWKYTIDSRICPRELHYTTSPDEGKYAACMSPCFASQSEPEEKIYCCLNKGVCEKIGGCQTDWPRDRFYNVFNNACPNCMITNCDKPLYYCESSKGLSQYVVTFCPTS